MPWRCTVEGCVPGVLCNFANHGKLSVAEDTRLVVVDTEPRQPLPHLIIHGRSVHCVCLVFSSERVVSVFKGFLVALFILMPKPKIYVINLCNFL